MIGLGAGVVLVIVGALAHAPGLIAVGVIVALVWLLRSLWTRFGLRGVTYERKLGATRALVGEDIPLKLTVRNRKWLPLPWLEVEDFVSEGMSVAGRPLEPSDQPGFGILRTTWTLGWFQRVTRTLNIVAERRGLYDFSTVRLRVADLFAPDSVESEEVEKLRYRIVPRHVPVRASAPLSDLPGTTKVVRGLFEEPALFAGVRPYQPGDPLKRIHWKASARLGRPVSRRYDPVHERDVVIALDAQTVPGPFWMMQYDDDLVEGLCVAAMSLARGMVAGGVACGLAVNAYTSQTELRSVYIAPSSANVADRAHRRPARGHQPLGIAALLDAVAQPGPAHAALDQHRRAERARFAGVRARAAAPVLVRAERAPVRARALFERQRGARPSAGPACQRDQARAQLEDRGCAQSGRLSSS